MLSTYSKYQWKEYVVAHWYSAPDCWGSCPKFVRNRHLPHRSRCTADLLCSTDNLRAETKRQKSKRNIYMKVSLTNSDEYWSPYMYLPSPICFLARSMGWTFRFSCFFYSVNNYLKLTDGFFYTSIVLPSNVIYIKIISHY